MNYGESREITSVSTETTVDKLFHRLQQEIVEGRIATGSKLSEPVIAKEYGVSRAPLREALGRLESAGLITRKPNIGCRVITLSHEHLLEIYQLREAIESLAAELAAKNMSQVEIKELDALLKQHEKQIQTDHHYFQKEGDMDFHFRIVKGSKNETLINLFFNDLYQLIRLYRFQFGMASRRVSRAFLEHGHIVDAIRQRDSELAFYLMKRHISQSRKNVELMLQEQSQEQNWGNQA